MHMGGGYPFLEAPIPGPLRALPLYFLLARLDPYLLWITASEETKRPWPRCSACQYLLF